MQPVAGFGKGPRAPCQSPQTWSRGRRLPHNYFLRGSGGGYQFSSEHQFRYQFNSAIRLVIRNTWPRGGEEEEEESI